SHRSLHLEFQFAINTRKRAQMRRKYDANHESVWASTESTAGRSRTRYLRDAKIDIGGKRTAGFQERTISDDGTRSRGSPNVLAIWDAKPGGRSAKLTIANKRVRPIPRYGSKGRSSSGCCRR